MHPSKVHVGTLPVENVRGVSSLEGPHLDDEGNPFNPKRQSLYTLDEAMSQSFSGDSFFTCYTLAGLEDTGWPRLKKSSLKSVRDITDVTMSCFAFDWDCPNHEPWSDEYIETFFTKVYDMGDDHLDAWRYLYTSRHGARLVYTLSEPVPVEEGEQFLTSMLIKFREVGLEMDEKCKDWTRLFRCPRVLRDGRSTEFESYFHFEERSGVLDISTLKKTPTRIIPVLKVCDVSNSSCPGPEEVDGYLRTKSPSGGIVQSAFYKTAKREIKKRNIPCFHSLFFENVPLAGAGERNDVIMKSIGSVIPVIIKECPYATPEHVYALFYGPVSAMEQTRDWPSHLWNAVMTIWPVEIDKYNEAKKEQAEKEGRGLSRKEGMIDGMSEWCDSPDLDNDDFSEAFLERHLLANFASFFYTMDKKGNYTPFPVTSNQLISRIRTTFMDDIVQTREIGSNGRMVDMTATSIQNNHATPVNEIVMIPQMESDGFIEDMDGYNPVLKLPMYRRNKNLKAEFSPFVDEWLAMLFGNFYEKAVDWISNALAFEEGPIAALSITAPPSVGKQLLVQGLAECLEKPFCASGQDAVGTFNGALSKTPFLAVNEAWPKGGNMSKLELLKQLTAGDMITVNIKFKPSIQIANPMRLILTANNHDMIRSLIDKEMSPDDREALGIRLLHFDLDGAASVWLANKGGHAFTGHRGNRWIAGVDGESDYVVAKHFLWLHEQRAVREFFEGRFLVAGNCDTGAFMTRQYVQRESTAVVIQAILEIVEVQNSKWCWLEEGTHKLYMTLGTIIEHLKANNAPMSFGDVSQVIRNIEMSQEPVTKGYQEYHELDCNALLMFASTLGRDTPVLRKIVHAQQSLRKQVDG